MAKTSTSFQSGGRKGGRPPGRQNHLTKTVKEAVLDAFNELQKDAKANLISWGKRNPNLFYPIAAKLIPTEMTGELNHRMLPKIVIELHGDAPKDPPQLQA